MMIVRNCLIPFPGFTAVNICGVIFVRGSQQLTPTQIRHEYIHTRQMLEMGIVFFYLWYLIEWVIRLFGKGNAYRNISFEREAYDNEAEKNYLKIRTHYVWLDYMNYE